MKFSLENISFDTLSNDEFIDSGFGDFANREFKENYPLINFKLINGEWEQRFTFTSYGVHIIEEIEGYQHTKFIKLWSLPIQDLEDENGLEIFFEENPKELIKDIVIQLKCSSEVFIKYFLEIQLESINGQCTDHMEEQKHYIKKIIKIMK